MSKANILVLGGSGFLGRYVVPRLDAAGYSLTVPNTGNIADQFVVSVGGNAWPVTLPARVGPLAAGVSVDIVVRVFVPGGARTGAQDTATVRLASLAAPAKEHSVQLTTKADAVRGFLPLVRR